MKCYAFADDEVGRLGYGKNPDQPCCNTAVQHWRTSRGKVFGFCEEHKTRTALVNGWTLLSNEEALLTEVHEQ